jgi:hypothetical protein
MYLTCKKLIPNLPMITPNQIYEHISVFNIQQFLVIKNEQNEPYCYWLSINDLLISDYFYTDKELRKLKLEKLYEI